MINIHPEYIVDENAQKKAVVLPFVEWEKIIEDMEELDDIRSYDAAASKGEEVISFDQAISEIEAGSVG